MERSFAMEILDILAQDSRTPAAIIAQMLNTSEEAVKAEIKRLEDEKILLRYTTIIDEEKAESESTIHALIEVKVTPQYRQGYDAIAEQVSRYPEVRSCYLMSGSYDFMVLVDGPNLRSVAQFVTEKLAVLNGVVSTGTHFVLRKYKDNHVVMPNGKDDRRQVVTP
ncbi:MAG: Lrp/AsnC family transcriptional regulator [Christensenellales bacterium]|jgi:DNA-binding Lrp family transcriptional regulator